jgi:predicted nuclease of restriction endonuclease-like (RecB) superfamily
MQGFSPQNTWRMKQFYETYKDSQILSSLLRELSWTNNLLVMSRAKTDEERLFYIRLAIDERYSSRELERQFNAMRFERAAISGCATVSCTNLAQRARQKCCRTGPTAPLPFALGGKDAVVIVL